MAWTILGILGLILIAIGTLVGIKEWVDELF